MPLTTKTRDQLEALGRAQMRGLIPEADLSDLTDYDVEVRILAALFLGNQEQARWLSRQILPSTADAEFALLHASLRGLELLPAAAAAGKVMITATAAGAIQGEGSALTHSDGTAYTLRYAVTTFTPTWTGKTVGEGSTVDRVVVLPDVTGLAKGDFVSIGGVKRVVKEVIGALNAFDVYVPFDATPTPAADITAETGVTAEIDADDAGAAGNKPAGDTLTLTTPVSGVDAEVTVLDVSGGGDVETTEELRQRVRDFMTVRPGSGNVEDFRQWARDAESTGVRLADACIYPNLRGRGAMDIVPIGVTGARRTGDDSNTKIQTYLDAVKPFCDDVLVKPLDYDAGDVTITLVLTPFVGYERDWDGTLTVNSSASDGSSLSFTPTLLAGIVEVGDRMLVPVTIAGQKRLIVAEVAGVAGAVASFVQPIGVAVPSSTVVYPGSPNSQAIVDAVEALFDELGPGVKDASGNVHPRHPSPALLWNPKLRLNRLIATVMGVEGIDTVSATAPATDLEPLVKTRLRLGTFTFTINDPVS